MVPAHLVRHHPVGLAVPAAAGDVERVVVVEDPDFRRLARRLAFEGHGLDEPAHAGHAVVDGVVETAVEIEGTLEAGGAHGGAAGLVAPDHFGEVGRRGAAHHGGGRRLRPLGVLPVSEFLGLRPTDGRNDQGRAGEDRAECGAEQEKELGRVTACQNRKRRVNLTMNDWVFSSG